MNWSLLLRRIREIKRPDLSAADSGSQMAFEYGYLEAVAGAMYDALPADKKNEIVAIFFASVIKP